MVRAASRSWVGRTLRGFLAGGTVAGLAWGGLFAAEEWPQFRGPRGDGHAETEGLPATWSENSNVIWKTPVPGNGHASPVIADGKVWLLTALQTPLTAEEKAKRLAGIPNNRGLEIAGKVALKALAFDVHTGKPLHDVELFVLDNPPPIHSLNSYASPTPVLEGGRLYCHLGTYGTACVDTNDGKIVWSNEDFHVEHQNGPGSSPVVWKDLVVAHFDGIDKQFVAAFHKATGKVAWKTDRSGKLGEKEDVKKAYCTPTIIQDQGRAVLVSPGADWVYGYDVETGTELWRINYGKLGFSTVPRPVIGHGMAYICTSYMDSRLLAIRLDGKGDVSKSHVAWTFDKQVPKKPSLLLVDDLLYMVNDGGVLTCLEALTGKELWKQRLGGDFSASPLYADGKLHFFNQQGKAIVIRPGRTYDEVSVNQLDEGFMASPAVFRRALILRTNTHLYRIQELVR